MDLPSLSEKANAETCLVFLPESAQHNQTPPLPISASMNFSYGTRCDTSQHSSSLPPTFCTKEKKNMKRIGKEHTGLFLTPVPSSSFIPAYWVGKNQEHLLQSKGKPVPYDRHSKPSHQGSSQSCMAMTACAQSQWGFLFSSSQAGNQL